MGAPTSIGHDRHPLSDSTGPDNDGAQHEREPETKDVYTPLDTPAEKGYNTPVGHGHGEGAKERGQELRRLKTLGEGPVAPVEAGYNARAVSRDGGGAGATRAGDDEEEMGVGRGEGGWVEPGYRGWLCVLGAFLANAICYGMTNVFGVFQEYYTSTHPIRLQADTTAISWIGSIQFCLCPLLGCIAGPLFDAGYLKSLLVAGGGLYVFSLMMTSIATAYWQILLAHGFGVGLGMGLFFSPSVSTLSHHFQRSKYRTLAYGLQASGSSLAGILYPLMLRALIPKVGFAWAMRILAFLVLAVVITAFFTLSRVHPPRKKLALLSPVVFRNHAYTLFVLGSGTCSLAIYAPLTFGATYMRAQGFDTGLAYYAIAISNGASIVGRIAPLFVAQRVGVLNVLCFFALTSGIMQFLWTLTRSATAFLVYMALYGVSSGAYAAAINPGGASFAPHPNQAGLYLGMLFFSHAWFWLAGTPATAALIQGQTNYLPASLFAGLAVTLGGMLLVVAKWRRSKQVGSVWI